MKFIENNMDYSRKEAEKCCAYGWLFISLAFQLMGVTFGIIYKWQNQYIEGLIAILALNLVALFFWFMGVKEKYGSYLDGMALFFAVSMRIRWDMDRVFRRHH